MAAKLKEMASETPQAEPSPPLREAIERRLAELEPTAGRATEQTKARPWWRSRGCPGRDRRLSCGPRRAGRAVDALVRIGEAARSGPTDHDPGQYHLGT